MPICPHCHRDIEELERVPWWKYRPMDRGVSLGCGTLILIAFIVAAFGGKGDVSDLSRKVDDLTVLVEEIHTSLFDTP